MIQARLVAICAACGYTAAYATPPSFTGVGDLAGGAFSSSVRGVAGFGGAAVGTATTSTTMRGVLWTPSGGLQDLGSFNAYGGSGAERVSSDGTVVIGTSDFGTTTQAYRWTSQGGMQGLGDLPGGAFASTGLGVSNDGNWVTGMSIATTGNQAFLWHQGSMISLGLIPGGAVSVGEDVSDDGSVVVGGGGPSSGSSSAFRWTAATGMQPLNLSTIGLTTGDGRACSADGSVVVGFGLSSSNTRAFRWSVGQGASLLGSLPGMTASSAFDVSADGLTIAGGYGSASGSHAFVWTQAGGMTDLKSLLISLGVTSVANWQLTSALTVSPDGTALGGFGVDPNGNQEGWVAVIPAPSTLIPLLPACVVAIRRRRTGGMPLGAFPSRHSLPRPT